jgi:cyclic-di-AMP phosphodiesterase PgpH
MGVYPLKGLNVKPLGRLLKLLQKGENTSPKSRSVSRSGASLFLALMTIFALTGVIGHRYYNEPQLTINTLAPQTIYAPQSASVEDVVATIALRNAARQSALNMFSISAPLTKTIESDFKDLLTQAQTLRRAAGALPFLGTDVLSTDVQRTLRAMDRDQLEALLNAIGVRKNLSGNPPESVTIPSMRKAWIQLNAAYLRYRSTPQWPQLSSRLLQANDLYQFTQRSVADPLTRNQADPILDIVDSDWKSLQSRLQDVLRRMLAQGIAPGLLPEVTRSAVIAQVKDWNELHQRVAQQLLPSVLRSNLVINPGETIRQQEQAAQQIPPIMAQIRKGDVIVREKELITSANFALLDHFGLSRRQINIEGLLTLGLGVTGAVGIFVWAKDRYYQRWSHQRWHRQDNVLVALLALSVPLMIVLTEVIYTTLPAVGLLIGSFYGSVVGASVVLLLSVLIPLGLQTNELTFAAIAIGSLVGSIMAGYARSREDLARVGIILGVVQTVVYAISLGGANSTGLYSLIGMSLQQGLIGVGWGVIALGISPYLEKMFDLITPIRLAELANPNRPLLKKLAQEAPGTFQHTQFVTTLAEAGARALNCNVELVRTGTLYHDIGKMHDPKAFIENQFGSPNKHAELNDPWMSAHLIRLHVTEGLVMARKAGLPSAVQAFIPEHQGTMLIAYFYHQACQLAQQQPQAVTVQEQDFRYEGPTPQSRETGIVMLADSCEAALRAMKQTDPADALRTVNQIFKTRWQDDQLVHSRLSREDLDTLAKVFVEVWQQVNHERIPYPQPITLMPRKSHFPRKP